MYVFVCVHARLSSQCVTFCRHLVGDYIYCKALAKCAAERQNCGSVEWFFRIKSTSQISTNWSTPQTGSPEDAKQTLTLPPVRPDCTTLVPVSQPCFRKAHCCLDMSMKKNKKINSVY